MNTVARLLSTGILQVSLFDELSGTNPNLGITSEGTFYSTEMKEGTAANLSSSVPMRITSDEKLLVYDYFDELTELTFNSPSSSSELRFKYYAYGATIGTLEIYWDDGSTLNGPLTFTANGSTVTSIAGQQQTATGQAWRSATCDLSSYGGDTGRVVFKYAQGSSFTGDIQLDAIELDHSGGTADLDPDLKRSASIDNWQQGDNNTTYSSAIFATVLVSTTQGDWVYDAGGTPSSATGDAVDSDGSSSGYYLYAETSGSFPADDGRVFWLRTINTYTL